MLHSLHNIQTFKSPKRYATSQFPDLNISEKRLCVAHVRAQIEAFGHPLPLLLETNGGCTCIIGPASSAGPEHRDALRTPELVSSHPASEIAHMTSPGGAGRTRHLALAKTTQTASSTKRLLDIKVQDRLITHREKILLSCNFPGHPQIGEEFFSATRFRLCSVVIFFSEVIQIAHLCNQMSCSSLQEPLPPRRPCQNLSIPQTPGSVFRVQSWMSTTWLEPSGKRVVGGEGDVLCALPRIR